MSLASCPGTDGRIGVGGLKPPLLNHATSFANWTEDRVVSMVRRPCF